MTMNNRNNYYYSNKIYCELTINYLNSKNILFINMIILFFNKIFIEGGVASWLMLKFAKYLEKLHDFTYRKK